VWSFLEMRLINFHSFEGVFFAYFWVLMFDFAYLVRYF
jgi:hypothetical protein